MIHKAVNRSSLFLLSTAEDLNSEGLTFAYDISDFHNTSCQRESEIATHPFESVCNYRINRHRVLIEFEPSGSNRRSIDLPRASLAPYRRISAHRMGRPVCIVTPANSCGLTKQHLAWCCSPSQETIDRGMDTRYYREGRGRVKGGLGPWLYLLFPLYVVGLLVRGEQPECRRYFTTCLGSLVIGTSYAAPSSFKEVGKHKGQIRILQCTVL